MDRLQFLYRLMKCADGFTSKLHQTLQYHYSDVCSDDDVVVQQILAALATNDSLDAFDVGLKTHIYRVLDRWKQQGTAIPDPWWAT